MGQAWPYLVYLFRRARVGSIAMSFGGYFLRHGRHAAAYVAVFVLELQALEGRTAPPPNYPRWIQPSLREEQDLSQRWNVCNRTAPIRASLTSARPQGNGQWALVFNTRERRSRAGRRVALQIRSPLLDQRVLHYSLRCRQCLGAQRKSYSVEPSKARFPEQIRLRSKTPFERIPWLHGQSRFKWNPLTHFTSGTPRLKVS